VINRAVGESPLAENWIESETAQIGDSFDGKKFTPAPVKEPKPEPKDKTDKLADVLIAKGLLTKQDLEQLK